MKCPVCKIETARDKFGRFYRHGHRHGGGRVYAPPCGGSGRTLSDIRMATVDTLIAQRNVKLDDIRRRQLSVPYRR